MPGFLTRAAAEDSEEEDNKVTTEETYLRLFPKIGRDFVGREDFIYILNQLISEINDRLHLDIRLDTGHDSRARSLAWQYSIALASQDYATWTKKDLIDLDD
jgi:hypothetical protein